MKTRNTLFVVLALSSATVLAETIYNSEADFQTATQGSKGWYYLYDAAGAGNYATMTYGNTFWGFSALRDSICTEAFVGVNGQGLVMHPASVNGCGGYTTLAWQAPLDGTATIQATAGTVDAACSGGSVDFELVNEAGTVLWSQSSTTHLVSYTYSGSSQMRTGERLYFRLTAGPNGAWCDTTGVQLGITFNEIYNHSFEIADPWVENLDDHSWNGTMVGWEFTPGVVGGTETSDTSLYFSGAPDGNNNAWINNGSASQDVTTVQAGETYELTAAVGWRLDEAAPGIGSLALAIDGVVVASAPLLGQVPGEWVDNSLRYTATAADAGRTLRVIVNHDGNWGHGDGQVDFDNVRLRLVPVTDGNGTCDATDTRDTDGDGVMDDCESDADSDGIDDNNDNCANIANADQADMDGDGIGNRCEADADADGLIDDLDNCPADFNADQSDSDADGHGDVCDLDDDGDGIADALDNCALLSNADQLNTDGDGQGDLCDGDDDADGVADEADLCQGTPLDVAAVNADGCSGSQFVESKVGSPTSYSTAGTYKAAVSQAANEAKKAGLLSGQEQGAIVSKAARR